MRKTNGKETLTSANVALALAIATQGLAANGARADAVSFHDIARDPAMNLGFERARSASRPALQAFYEDSLVAPVPLDRVFAETPHRTGGFPGVALLDHDGDGDVDIYVTNGPGAPNALYENRLADTGTLGFIDASAGSGAEATDLDANGVCFGDLDNDGDEDLFVLGREAPNRLFENLGGRFRERTGHGAEGGTSSHVSCSMGDVDGDGLLDIAVANVFALDSALALVAEPYALNQRNELYRNSGAFAFEDIGAASGIHRMTLGGTTDPTPPTISWAVAMVDVDRDGDTDIVFGDDQAGLPNAARGGFDRGYLQVFLNDGDGRFENAPVDLNEHSSAAWMALGLGDLDCDGTIDIFASNLGSYMSEATGVPSTVGAEATRWLLGTGDGGFVDPGPPGASVFGWGNAVADLDNDGDQDVLYHGAMDLNALITHDNPGVVLENQGCTATFALNLDAFRGDYTTRGTQGVAVADLDRDGFVDVVTVANHRVPDDMPFSIGPAAYGSPLDASARFYLPMVPDASGALWSWTGIDTLPGDLTVEINQGRDAGNGNAAVSVRARGGVGLVPEARVNRSGVGAVLSLSPAGLPTVSVPIVAGSSFTSQHALDAHFGMGRSPRATLEVLWPGGARNRLYGVRPGERLTLPEIPCSIDTDAPLPRYLSCVSRTLHALKRAGEVDRHLSRRLLRSAVRAWLEERRGTR